MEAWKFINYTSLSPLLALTFTTERWGLDPFPGNLVAISGTWEELKESNKTSEEAWTLPNLCPINNNSDIYFKYKNWIQHNRNARHDKVGSISPSSEICPKPQPCADSGCLILVEGVGKNTTGPANSDIVRLTLGISGLVVIAITVAILAIMGCCWSRWCDMLESPPPPNPLNIRDLGQYVNPPRPRGGTYEIQTAAPTNMAKEVARCSDLLRQMYALELVIWGMEGAVAAEAPQRREKERMVNALFAEVRGMLAMWKLGSGWSVEEEQHIEEIYKTVARHRARRYTG